MARLSLQDPLFVSVHENASESTPTQLEQVSLVRTSSIRYRDVWKGENKFFILIFMPLWSVSFYKILLTLIRIR